MKRQRTLLMVALFAAGQAVAQDMLDSALASKATNARRPAVHWFAPAQSTGMQDEGKAVGGLSPRAWTTTAGWNPGMSAFPDARTSGPQACLFWTGHGPWHHETRLIDGQ
jgi:hypothetical protein